MRDRRAAPPHRRRQPSDQTARRDEIFHPHSALRGSTLTAGVLAGLLGPGQRFASDGQLAAYAGVAPLEASSGMRVRHRLSRVGNRRLNSVIYRIVLTQAYHSPDAQEYLARRMSQGKTRQEAIVLFVATSPERCGGSGRVPQRVGHGTDADGRVTKIAPTRKTDRNQRPWAALLTLTERISARSSISNQRLHIGASHRVASVSEASPKVVSFA